jgi:hypothetical protein
MWAAVRTRVGAGLVSAIVLIGGTVSADAGSQPDVATCLRASEGCAGKIEVELVGSLSPRRLPMNGSAPASLEIHGKIANENGGHPPALREAIVDVAKGAAVDTTGLPTCRLRQLESNRVGAARRLCRSAIVGNGIAHVGFGSSEAIVKTPLTLFNGGTSYGETRLFIQGWIAAPAPTPVVAIAKVSRKRQGLHSIWRVPPILEGDGSLLDFSFRIDRRFMNRGLERSYLAAGCHDGVLKVNLPRILFRNEAHSPGQAGATVLQGGLALPCTPTE